MSVAVATVGAQDEAPRTVALVRPIVKAAALVEAHKELAALIAAALERDRDYGVVPGTKGKPSLLKPGAERLATACGLRPEFDVVEQEIDHFREVTYTKRQKVWRNQYRGDKSFDWKEESGTSTGFYRYVLRCRLISRETGMEAGQGVGSCSTLESKYIDRPRDSENTALKMAKKRAYVDAVLTTLGLSDRFTQDVEDLSHDERPANVDADGVVHGAHASDAADASVPTMPGDASKWDGHGGKPLSEVPLPTLKKARKWMVEKDAAKFADQIAAMDAELARRKAAAPAPVRDGENGYPESDVPLRGPNAVDAPPTAAAPAPLDAEDEEDDDLPF